MDKKRNGAITTLAGDLQASWGSFVVKTWEGDLFKSDSFPYKLTFLHYEGTKYTKKEILTVSGRDEDAFTIESRSVETCVQDETASPKVRSSNALSFESWDVVFEGITEWDWNGLIDEVVTNIQQDIVDAKNELKEDIQKQSAIYWASNTWNDAYAVTLDPVPTALTAGMVVRFLSDVWNSWDATLNVNGLGAKAIKKGNDQDLEDGDIEALQMVVVVYNSTDDVFEMTSQKAGEVSVNVEALTTEVTLWETVVLWDPLRLWTEIPATEISLISSSFFWDVTEVTQYFTVGAWERLKDRKITYWWAWNAGVVVLKCEVFDSDDTSLWVSADLEYASNTHQALDFVFPSDIDFTLWGLCKFQVTRVSGTSNWEQYYNTWSATPNNFTYNNGTTRSESSSYALETVTLEDFDKYYKAYADDDNKKDVKGVATTGGSIDTVIKMAINWVTAIPSALKKVWTVTGSVWDTSGTSQVYYNGTWPWQTFTVPNDSVINSITLNNGWNTRTYEYRLYKDGVLIGTTGSTSTSGIQTLSFTNSITLIGWDTYEVRVANIQDTAQKSVYYNTSDVYANWTRTDAGVATTWDLYFEIDYTELTDLEIWDSIYLSDDGKISGTEGSNSIILWEIIRDTAVKLSIWGSTWGVDFVSASTSWGGASYSVTYSHNLWKKPTKFECFTERSGWASHGWFEEEKYGCAGAEGWAREDCIGILYYSSWDYFKMTISNVSDSSFDVDFTEVWSCSTFTSYLIFKLT